MKKSKKGVKPAALNKVKRVLSKKAAAKVVKAGTRSVKAGVKVAKTAHVKAKPHKKEKNVGKKTINRSRAKSRHAKISHSTRKHHKKHAEHHRHSTAHHAAKKEKAGRVQTYIKNFDSLVEGGFTKNSTNLVVGSSGSGKSIFATQFLIEGMDRGEKSLYVTFEEKKEQFYENMLSLGWDLEEYERKGLFTFLEYTPIKVRTMLEEGGGAIENTILDKKVKRVVIDSITSFALLFQDEFSAREAALSLFAMIRGWDCTSLLTLEEEPMVMDKATSRAIEFEVDSIVVFYFLRNAHERQRYLEILKMRGTNHSKKVYPFDIARKGVAIKKSPVSKMLR